MCMNNTPQQHDELIAAKYFRLDQARQELKVVENKVRKQAGQTIDYRSRNTPWVFNGQEATLEDAERECEANAEVHNPYERVLVELDEARKVIAEIKRQIARLEDQYTGWSRFFLVTSSAGHIHSSMRCDTCYPDTTYGWLPELSGKTETIAIFEVGEALCARCFPSAPKEWKLGKITAAKAQKMAWSPDRDEKIAKAAKAKEEKAAKKAAKEVKALKYAEGLAIKVNKLIDMFGDNDKDMYEWTWTNKGYDNAYYVISDMSRRRHDDI